MPKSETEQELQAAERLRLELESEVGLPTPKGSSEEELAELAELAALGNLAQLAQRDWTLPESPRRRAEVISMAKADAAKKRGRLASLTLLRPMIGAFSAAAVLLLVLRVVEHPDDSEIGNLAPGAVSQTGSSSLPSKSESSDAVPSRDALFSREDLLRAQATSLARRAAGGKSEAEEVELAMAWRAYRGRLISELGRER